MLWCKAVEHRVSDEAVSALAKERGLTFRVEQCPMPGWTTGDNFHNNIGYTPGTWIALHRICTRHGVGDQFRIHYDPTQDGADVGFTVLDRLRAEMLHRVGLADLLSPAKLI